MNASSPPVAQLVSVSILLHPPSPKGAPGAPGIPGLPGLPAEKGERGLRVVMEAQVLSLSSDPVFLPLLLQAIP